MIVIKYKPTDLRYLFLYGDNDKELRALEAHLNKIPNYIFLPSFSGIPKPEVFLNKFYKDNKLIYWCPSGLWKEIVDWCKEHNIECSNIAGDNDFKYRNIMDESTFTAWVNSLNLSLELRPYQIHAAWLILKFRMSLSQLATRSGKTLIAYVVFRYLLEIEGAHNILMIVPAKHLIKQGVADMAEYSEFFKTETVWAKGELCESSNLTIGTFQSLIKIANKKYEKYNPKWFNKFDVVCCDECHTVKCESIQTILKLDFMKNLKIKFGFSGTLPLEHTIESYRVQSMLGPCIQDISSKELQDAGYLAKADITQIHIDHPMNQDLINKYIRCGEYLVSNYDTINGKKIQLPKELWEYTIKHKKTLPYSVKVVKETMSDLDYIDYLVDLCKANGSNLLMLEQMLVHRDNKRLAVMDRLLDEMNGNVIVFAHHTEYIKRLVEYFKSTHPEKEVFSITGSVSLKKREKYQQYMLDHNNVVLVASYSCVGTGLTFKNLDYGIFAQSFKSEIINKQSIGRGLLRAPSKDTFYLYDIIDEFPTGRLKKHGHDKFKLWKKEGFELHTVNI